MSGSTQWMLGGEPPEQQKVSLEPKKAPEDLSPSDYHTGTDPLGRAIGPEEDHTEIKKVYNADGKVVDPTDTDEPEEKKPRRRTAKKTSSKKKKK